MLEDAIKDRLETLDISASTKPRWTSDEWKRWRDNEATVRLAETAKNGEPWSVRKFEEMKARVSREQEKRDMLLQPCWEWKTSDTRRWCDAKVSEDLRKAEEAAEKAGLKRQRVKSRKVQAMWQKTFKDFVGHHQFEIEKNAKKRRS